MITEHLHNFNSYTLILAVGRKKVSQSIRSVIAHSSRNGAERQDFFIEGEENISGVQRKQTAHRIWGLK